MRERGSAVNVEESEDGVASVAVAVHGPRLAPAAALAVSGPVSRMTGEVIGRIEAELRERAAWLETQLAGTTAMGLLMPGYLTPTPPSEWTTVPVMPRARSEARNT